jgi:uncharacterized protein (TIGR02246 family)
MGACLSLWATGCDRQVAVEEKVDLAQEEQAIRAITTKWLDLDKAHDSASQAELFDQDSVVIRENQEPVFGQAAIREMYAQYYEQNPELIPDWSTERIEIAASGDLAVEYGNWNSSNGGPDGTDSDQGKYVTVYRKTGGTWKVASDTSVSTKPEEPAQ